MLCYLSILLWTHCKKGETSLVDGAAFLSFNWLSNYYGAVCVAVEAILISRKNSKTHRKQSNISPRFLTLSKDIQSARLESLPGRFQPPGLTF